jgi:hypothetical protein
MNAGTAPSDLATQKIENAARYDRSFHTPEILREAATLLDELYAAGERHGVGPEDWAGVTSMPSAALDVVRTRHRWPRTKRTFAEVDGLRCDVVAALAELGVAAGLGPRGVEVRPLPGGLKWGPAGEVGLLVSLYTDGGWDLSVDAHMAPVQSVYAPVTPAGAREVAAVVKGVLTGETKLPKA